MANGDDTATPTTAAAVPAGLKKYKVRDNKSGDTVEVWGPAENPDQQKLFAAAQAQFLKRRRLDPIDLAKSIPRGLVRGAASLPALASELGKPEVDILSQAATGQPSGVPAMSAEQMTSQIETAADYQMHKPETRGGKIGERIGEFLGDPTSWIGPGGPIIKGTTAVLGAIGSEEGERLGAKYGHPVLGAIAGGAIGGGVTGAAVPRGLPARVPRAIRRATTEEATKAASQEAYGEMSMLQYELPQAQAHQLRREIVRELERGVTVDGERMAFRDFNAPNTWRILDHLTTPQESRPASAGIMVSDIENVRAELNGNRLAGGPEGKASTAVIQALDDYLLNLPGVAGISERARKNWAAYKRGQIVEEVIRRAVDRAGGSGTFSGNMDNVLKQEFRTRIRNNEKVWGRFSKREQEEIERIMHPGVALHFANWASGLSPFRHRVIGGGAVAGAGLITHDPFVALALVAAGEGGALASRYLQLGRAERLVDITRARSPAGGNYTPRPTPTRAETGAAGALRAAGSSAFSPAVSNALELPEITVRPGD